MRAQIRAVVYGRVSTEDQVDGTSLEDQRRICRQAIDQRGWAYSGEFFDEGITGTKRTRPAWQTMLAAIRDGEVDAVVVSKLDRFARNAGHAITETDHLAELGVHFVSVKEAIDLTTAHGRMMRTMLAGFAELERDTIVERTVAGQRAKAREGRWPGGQPPFGWRLSGKGRSAEPVIDEREREIVEAVYTWFVRDGLTSGQVADRLNDAGMRPRKAARWSYEVVRRMFTNSTLYTGVTVWGVPDGRTGGKHTKMDRDGRPKYGEPVERLLPDPPLSKRQYDALCRAIARNCHGRPRGGAASRELTGRLYGECGQHYTGVNLSHRETDVYRCTGRRHQGVGAPRCSCQQVTAQAVEADVWAQVVALLGDPSRLRAMAAQWLQISDGEGEASIDEVVLQRTEQQVAKLERARVNAAREVLMADDPEPYREALADIEADLAKQRERLAALDALRADAAGRATRLTDLAQLAQRAAERLPSMTARQRAEVLTLLDVRVTMGPIVGGVPQSLILEGRVDPRLFEGGSTQEDSGPDDGGTPDGGGQHRDLLLAAGLHERAATGLADVLGLRTQDVGERGAALERDGDTLGEARQGRQTGPVRHGGQGRRDGAASADVGEHARELGREISACRGGDPLESGHRPLARRDGQRQELGHGGELGEHPLLAAPHGGAQLLVAQREAEPTRQQHEGRQRDRRRSADRREQQRGEQSGRETQHRPDDLSRAELVDALGPPGPVEPAADLGAGRTQPLEPVRGVGEPRRDEALDHRERRVHDLLAQQAGGRVARSQGGRESLVERDPSRTQPGEHQQETQSPEQPHQRSRERHPRAHRSTRPSSGRRPIRRMSR